VEARSGRTRRLEKTSRCYEPTLDFGALGRLGGSCPVVRIFEAYHRPHDGRANQFMATIAAVQSVDGIENMMAVQMAVAQQALLGQAQRLRGDLSIEQHEMHANMLNKLARTFAAQVDTLKRHRSKGDQRVTVVHEHKHVHLRNEASPQGGGGGTDEIEGRPHE